MIITEQIINQKNICGYINESGDMLQYFQDNYQPWLKEYSKQVDKENIPKENVLKAVQGKTLSVTKDKEQSDNDTLHIMKAIFKNWEPLNESFDTLKILSLSNGEAIKYNSGDILKTLQEISDFMSSIQGTINKDERKAYFKARKLYSYLTNYMNKKEK